MAYTDIHTVEANSHYVLSTKQGRLKPVREGVHQQDMRSLAQPLISGAAVARAGRELSLNQLQ
jgi:hypothetical protein